MEIQPIAHAKNGFQDKFGIPRQSSESSLIETRIVFEPAYRNPDAIRGIEDFSYLWLIWGFNDRSENLTVRPPRLGGNTRVGVFATRSPFRPNPLGISSVRLLRVEKMPDGSQELVVNGADLLDGTPIFDIKPYLRYSDSHPDANNGFAEETKYYRLVVNGLDKFKNPSVPSHVLAELQEILEQDPRPAYQDDPTRIYKLDYSGFTVSFSVKEDTLFVLNIVKNDKK